LRDFFTNSSSPPAEEITRTAKILVATIRIDYFEKKSGEHNLAKNAAPDQMSVSLTKKFAPIQASLNVSYARYLRQPTHSHFFASRSVKKEIRENSELKIELTLL
jgi:hypothetical protein